MLRKFINKNPTLGFSVFVFLICALNLLINSINGRFWLSDFRVYYSAAENFLSGGTVYQQAYGLGSGFYKYSPVVLFFFVPFTLFNYTVASIIHFVILTFAFWYTFIISGKLLENFFPGTKFIHKNLLLSLSFVFILLHLVRELHLGNINILLLLLGLLALKYYLVNKPVHGSILLGIVLLTKPFFLILIIPLVLRKYWKALAWLGIVIAAGLAVPFIFAGPVYTMGLYSGWMTTIRSHDQDFPGMNSADYLMRYWFFPGLPGYIQHLIIVAAGLLISFFVLRNIHAEQRFSDSLKGAQTDLIYEWILILALIPNLVRTDSEHFLATAPILVFILFYIVWRRKYFLIPVMIFLFFFYGGNSYDLLGKDLSHKLFESGFLGLSNLLILGVSYYAFSDIRRRSFSRDTSGISS